MGGERRGDYRAFLIYLRALGELWVRKERKARELVVLFLKMHHVCTAYYFLGGVQDG